MSKQPYIPLYIGDWERDTNCLSLEAEGALLKLIFKMWDSTNKGKLEFSFNQLSILLKKSEENTRKIVSELHENGTLDIEFIGKDRVKFESRRILKDIAKSLIYRENGSKGGRPVKAKQKLTKSKSKAKVKLITDNDIDNDIESDNVFEKGKSGKAEKNQLIDLIPSSWPVSEFTPLWSDYILGRKQRKRPLTENAAKINLQQLVRTFPMWPDAKARMEKVVGSGWLTFVFDDDKTKSSGKTKNIYEPGYYDKA